MRFVNLTEASEQRTHVMPLNVVIQRVPEYLLGGHAVVVIQLDRHSQPPRRGLRYSALRRTLYLLDPNVKEPDEFYVLGHRKQVKHLELLQRIPPRLEGF